MFNLEYAQIIKIRTSVSLKITTTLVSTLESCNTRRVTASSWLQPLITWFTAGEVKYSLSLEVIIKGGDLGRIPEPNSSTHCFVISINWSLHSLLFKSSCHLLPYDLFCSKPVMKKLVEELLRFCLVIFLILYTLSVSLINLNSFIVIELSENMDLISAEIHSLQVFWF